MFEKLATVIGGIVLIILAIAGVSIVMAYPVKWLVNYLFTPGVLMAVFGVTKFSIWRALWLSVLCGLLFKSTVSSSK
jgi:hypothetical protein